MTSNSGGGLSRVPLPSSIHRNAGSGLSAFTTHSCARATARTTRRRPAQPTAAAAAASTRSSRWSRTGGSRWAWRACAPPTSSCRCRSSATTRRTRRRCRCSRRTSRLPRLILVPDPLHQVEHRAAPRRRPLLHDLLDDVLLVARLRLRAHGGGGDGIGGGAARLPLRDRRRLRLLVVGGGPSRRHAASSGFSRGRSCFIGRGANLRPVPRECTRQPSQRRRNLAEKILT